MKNSLTWIPIASGMLVLVLSLGLAFVTVATRSGNSVEQASSRTSLQSQASEQAPTLSLSPTSGEYVFDTAKGTSYPVGIVVDTAGKEIDGVDVVISYDPSKISIVDGKVSPTTILPEVPLNKVDAAKGKIKFSALTFEAKTVSGILGTFSIKPLQKGEANLTIEFVPGATTDSNVAEHGTALDVLGKVENANYIFK